MSNRSERRKQLQDQQQKKTILTIAIWLGVILIVVAVFSSSIQSSPGSGAAQGNLSTIPAEVNYPAPELALENIAGKTEALTDYRDQVVLVNNWATWCPPCKAEMPTLAAFYDAHASEGFMIVAIEAGDAKDQVQAFADQLQLPFAIWLDPKGASLNAFKNSALPNSYVIDRTGTVRLMWTGEITREMLEKYVTPLLNGG